MPRFNFFLKALQKRRSSSSAVIATDFALLS
jgi:hypothetical protein